MAYEVFVRKKRGGVINELYKKPEHAVLRFLELAKKYPEVSLQKRRKNIKGIDHWRKQDINLFY